MSEPRPLAPVPPLGTLTDESKRAPKPGGLPPLPPDVFRAVVDALASALVADCQQDGRGPEDRSLNTRGATHMLPDHHATQEEPPGERRRARAAGRSSPRKGHDRSRAAHERPDRGPRPVDETDEAQPMSQGGTAAMRLTDEQVKQATAAMRERQEALKMGTVEIDALERLALAGNQGARLVVFQAYRRLVL